MLGLNAANGAGRRAHDNRVRVGAIARQACARPEQRPIGDAGRAKHDRALAPDRSSCENLIDIFQTHFQRHARVHRYCETSAGLENRRPDI